MSFTSATYINLAKRGFYYISSRYYDPEVGRFISADTTDVLGVSSDLYDKNLYAYCDNNPVMREDVSGEFWNIAVGAVIGAGLRVAAQMFDNWISGTNLTDGLLLAAAGGAITGGLAATGAGKWAQTAVSGLVGAEGILSPINIVQVVLTILIGDKLLFQEHLVRLQGILVKTVLDTKVEMLQKRLKYMML